MPAAIPLSETVIADHIAIYEHLHAHPELSSQEHETAAYITARLAALGIRSFPSGGTGVVGILDNGDGPVVAFRADTDGLPIAEQTGLPYASTVTGVLPNGDTAPVMHGCGHDTHITAALAAAELFAAHRDAWHGTIVFVFQPAEETAAGAKAMVDDGLWDKAPRPDIVLAQHVGPLPAGTVALAAGNMATLADSWRITVHGTQAHGSQPEASIDPILIAASTVVRLQSIVARELSPRTAAVVTVGTFHAGLKENIIPDRAEFTVNVRTPDETVRKAVLDAIRRIVSAEAAAGRAPEPTIEPINNFPRLYNDPDLTPEIAAALRAEFGDRGVIEQSMGMGSEDAGWLGDAIGVPVVFWGFGAVPMSAFDFDAPTIGGMPQVHGGGVPAANHSPHFAPDARSAVETGTRAAVAALLRVVGR